MKRNHTHQARSPSKQNNFDKWECQVIENAAGSFNKEQIANILTFLGSKRNGNSVQKKAGELGWSLKIRKAK